VALIRYLQLREVAPETGFAPDPLWMPVTNLVLWAVIFAVFAVVATRKARARQ
jgi:ABC-2 type transport system permease protein